MKKIILTILVALPLAAAAQTLKLGHFNSHDVMQSMPEMAAAQTELNAQIKKHDDEYMRIATLSQQAVEEFTAVRDSLPANIADRRQKEMLEQGQKVQEYAQFADQDLQELQRKLLEPIVVKLNAAVQAVGDAEGMTYIFNIANVDIPYVNEKTSIDLTPAIKTRLGIR